MQYPYDEAKFKELLLYVAEQLEGDPASGAIKPNKVLFFSEFAHMRAYGRPITGAEYQKLEHGPAPRRLVPVRDELLHAGAAVLKAETYMGYQQHRLVPIRKADRSVFTTEELEVVDQVVAEVRGASGAEVSALSHEEMGWRMVEEGETIPFEAAYLAKPILTHAIKEHAAELAPPRREVVAVSGGPTRRRRVNRSEYFLEETRLFYPPGGSTSGRPSFERFEDGPLRAVEELFARRFEDQPEAAPGIRFAVTHGVPFFPPMVFYACLVNDDVELIDFVADEGYWDLIREDPLD